MNHYKCANMYPILYPNNILKRYSFLRMYVLVERLRASSRTVTCHL